MNILLGHLVGDYIFQNKWMAMNKSGSTFKCMIHCLIYTLCVCIATCFDPIWIGVVFCSHFFIDRFSLADKWLDFINGRSLRDFVEAGHLNISIKGGPERHSYRILRGGFHALVYTVVDNTMHLVIMYIAWNILYPIGILFY